MTGPRRWTLRVAVRAMVGLGQLNRIYGPWFTGALAVLILLVVMAAVTRFTWLIAVAGVLAMVMSVWVFRAGVEDVQAEPEPKPKPGLADWEDTLRYYRHADPSDFIGLHRGRKVDFEPSDGLVILQRYRQQWDRSRQDDDSSAG